MGEISAFSWPILVSFLVPAIGGFGSLYFISHSHRLGAESLVAAGNGLALLLAVQSIAFGYSTFASIQVAKGVGARDGKATAGAVLGALQAIAIVSVAIAIALALFIQPYLDFINLPAQARGETYVYLAITIASLPIRFLFPLGTGLLRGMGYSRRTLWCTCLLVLLQVGLVPILINGFWLLPPMDIAGAALAPVVATLVVVCWMAWMIARDPRSGLSGDARGGRRLSVSPAEVRNHMSRGGIIGFQMMLSNLALLAVLGMVNAHGVRISAAYLAAVQILGYLEMPALAVSSALSPLLGQRIGASDKEGARSMIVAAFVTAIAVAVTLTAGLYLMGTGPYALILTPGSGLEASSLRIGYIIVWSAIPAAATSILFGMLRAYGILFIPAVASFVGMWLIRVPLAAALGDRLGVFGICLAIDLSVLVTLGLAISMHLYHRPYDKLE